MIGHNHHFIGGFDCSGEKRQLHTDYMTMVFKKAS